MKKLVYIVFFLLISINSFAQDAQEEKDSALFLTNINVYPNPFNDKTNISFMSSQDGSVNFIVQDLLGNIIKSDIILVSKGKNSIPFYRDRLISGIYIYTLKTNNKVISKRFVIK